MHGRLKPLNDLTRRHSSGKNRPGAVHGSSQHSVTNTSNISAQARQFRPRRVHKLGFINTNPTARNDDQVNVRIDQKISDQNNLFGRVTWSELGQTDPASL